MKYQLAIVPYEGGPEYVDIPDELVTHERDVFIVRDFVKKFAYAANGGFRSIDVVLVDEDEDERS